MSEMDSGLFPVDSKSVDGEFLLGAIEGLEDFIADYETDVCSGESGGKQFDNAVIDGGYLEKLCIARGLIKECIRDE